MSMMNSVVWIGGLLGLSAVMPGAAHSQALTDASVPASDFMRVTWSSECESDSAKVFFFIDLTSQGELRYQGLADTKILGSKAEQIKSGSARRLRAAIRTFLKRSAAEKTDDVQDAAFCLEVQAYEAGRLVDSGFERVSAAQPTALLRSIDQLASPKRWACPARLSIVRGMRSSRYCSERPAFTMTVAGKSACDLTRHVEVHVGGTVYVATYGPRLKDLRAHDYYEVGPKAVAALVDTINTFPSYKVEIEQPGPTSPAYFRARAENIETIKARLTELAGISWALLDEAEPCVVRQGPISEIALRRDLDRAAKDSAQ